MSTTETHAASAPPPGQTETTSTRPALTRSQRDQRAARLRFVALLIVALVWLFPLVWILITALSPAGSVTGGGLPAFNTLSLDTIRAALDEYPIATWALNSAAIAVVAVVLTVFVDLLAGYVLAKRKFPGRAVVLLAIIATLMIPVQVLLIPQFELVAQLGWVNSYWAVIIPRSAEAFGIFLARQYMLAIPDELLEAAALDGANQWKIFTRIVLPQARPLIAVLIVMTFMYRWNEFAWPLVALRDPDLYTLPVGLAFLQGQFATDYPTLMAGALLSMLPILALFIVAQRYFVAGLARSGLK